MTFRNSILAGTTLVRQAIQSQGFTTDVDGWQIQRDGDAELNNATVRGSLVVQGDKESYVIANALGTVEPITTYERPDHPHGNMHYSVPAINEYGIVFSEQVAADGDFQNYPALWFTPTSGEGGDDGIWFLTWGGGTRAFGYDQTTGFAIFAHYDSSIPSITRETWQTLSLDNGWNTIAGRDVPAVRLMPDGMVQFKGSAEHGTAGTHNGETFAHLPSGYEPDHEILVPMATNNGIACMASILSNGDMRLSNVNSLGAIFLAGMQYTHPEL